MLLVTVAGLLLALCLAAAIKYYILARSRIAQATTGMAASAPGEGVGPTHALEERNQTLTDQVEQLKTRIQNASVLQATPKEIDRKSPALALFSPIIVDRTREQNRVSVSSLGLFNSESGPSLTFELHNVRSGESTEKGYIVVLARAESGLMAYPNVFSETGPYLLDFEKGETFQVARFRKVNAQFPAGSGARHFQVFIFTRTGELLVNAAYEAKDDAGG